MKKAFTLIELLVVIAIIAILAAILFPVFAQAKLAAKKTAGLNATKQIGLATNIYINDVDDVLPPYRLSVANSAPAGRLR
ncbi:prepilin-type N-terminal cleavage/methylation domain-containing protein [bacterium]|nr:MAG: prepilin-type N-terminal cleavage/methylation domain-containing protein [bacterium]